MDRGSDGDLGPTESLRDLHEALDRLLTLWLKWHLHELLSLHLPRHTDRKLHDQLVKRAKEGCRKPQVQQWLTEQAQSADFCGLVQMFHFLRKRIEEEERKDHSAHVHVVFVAHGAIRDAMTPACCLLPLSSVTDVLLYSPWNCATSAEVTYAIATGRIRPSHRVFDSRTRGGSEAPADRRRPAKLPDSWNSLKEAGDQMIPNIMVSPLRLTDGVWARYKCLEVLHGAPGRDRIVIPFMGAGLAGSVPFSVVSLALGLALQASRFTATVHLDTCLCDQSEGQRFDPGYLQSQYACADSDTIMTVSAEALQGSWLDRLRRRFS